MNQLFSQISTAVAYHTGRSTTFIVALLLVLHMARDWPTFPLFRHMAACHQHSNIRSHVLDGIRNTEHAES